LKGSIVTDFSEMHTGGIGGEQYEAMVLGRVPATNVARNISNTDIQWEHGIDLAIVLREMDILADELAKLEASMDRTAVELRLAQLREVVEFRYKWTSGPLDD
jgi:hypothetical protein